MKEFLEQLGFEDITPDNPFYMKESLNEYFDWDKAFNALYRRYADYGIITYIMHGIEGNRHWVDMISIYGHKWLKAHQLAPSEYIKEFTLDLLMRNEVSVIRL